LEGDPVTYINIHEVETAENEDEHAIPQVGDHNLVQAYYEHEEVLACAKLLELLHKLRDGKALVIRRDQY
jgi:hypothetical protein